MWKYYVSVLALTLAVILSALFTSSKLRLDQYYETYKLAFSFPSSWEANYSSVAASDKLKSSLLPPSSCSYRPKASSCPSSPYYNNACSEQAQRKYQEKLKSDGWRGLTMEQLEEAVGNKTDELLIKLRSVFHQRRVVLVGDSLMRQWFETISCRLGLPANWFELQKGIKGNTDPTQRLEKIMNASGFGVPPLNRPPGGLANCSGYSVASTKLSNVDNTTDYCGFHTTIEYVKYNGGISPKQNISNLWNALATTLEDEVDSNLVRETLLIFNFGLHYTKSPRELYIKDLDKAFKACGDLNRLKPGRIRCLFRDVFPQHHFIKPPQTRFPPDWRYNPNDLGKGCGPFDEFQNQVVFPNFTEFHRLAESHHVPVIKILDSPIWLDAWNYHNDCTHYCQDSLLWDVLHWTLVDLLEKKDPSVFMPTIDSL
jgi:hypothetical protein